MKVSPFRATYAVQESCWAREATTWSLPGKGRFRIREVTWEVGGVWERYGGISCMIFSDIIIHWMIVSVVVFPVTIDCLHWALNDCASSFWTL